MQRFRWTIEKKEENLYIEFYLPITIGGGKGKNWLYLSIQSILELCSKLTEDVIFYRKEISPINNDIENIFFHFSASRERPLLEIYCKSNRTVDNKKRGYIDIPIHPLGDIKLNMTYISPFLEELKRYID